MQQHSAESAHGHENREVRQQKTGPPCSENEALAPINKIKDYKLDFMNCTYTDRHREAQERCDSYVKATFKFMLPKGCGPK